MPKVVIELDADLEAQLQTAAAAAHMTKPELCREAVERFLRTQQNGRDEPSADAYEPLRKMIGLVKVGPDDASIHHDIRAGEDP